MKRRRKYRGAARDGVTEVLGRVVEQFISGEVAEKIAKVVYPALTGIPSCEWSLSNRVIQLFSGTADARGFRQWKTVGRNVVKGSRCIYILAPCLITDREAAVDPTTGKHPKKLIGFRGQAVFAVESTKGDEVDYGDAAPVLPEHPLLNVAEEWCVSVAALPGSGMFYGCYTTGTNKIMLCTPDEGQFFHELVHAGHARLAGGLEIGLRPDQEIIAQLGSEVLARLYGRTTGNEGYSYEYIRGYAKEWFPGLGDEEAVASACSRVLHTTCRIIESITLADEATS